MKTLYSIILICYSGGVNMENLHTEIVEPTPQRSNMPNYEEARASFRWQDVEAAFSWSATGKVNMAYEAIDRHAESARGNKVALFYSDDKRDEQYTFAQMKQLSNQAAHVLKQVGVSKG